MEEEQKKDYDPSAYKPETVYAKSKGGSWRTLFIVFGVIVAILIAFVVIARFRAPEGPQSNSNAAVITDFKSCAAAGNPVMESYPRQCRANGQTFTEVLVPVGSSCNQSADCQLPMDYAARSNCPYRAFCYNQKCVVGCPSWEEKTNTWEVKCQADKDCNCATWNEQKNYTCACVDGQCASIVADVVSDTEPEPIACTQEAKICPDGSAVSRSGQNCEFAPCPGVSDQSNDCQKNNGTWLAEYKECEYISRQVCEQLGGVFSECESACRHDPQAQMCTLQCVSVCKF
ncbi:MAG: hypothetical protein NTZ49_03710 [Candidatus Parcubacteria bacterium]|nr:hypothetical protein [Candidatus Parcubacteria bacterium]